jgi:hypothetical protein
VADGLDDARNAGVPTHDSDGDDNADMARNWHDGDNDGPTEAA